MLFINISYNPNDHPLGKNCLNKRSYTKQFYYESHISTWKICIIQHSMKGNKPYARTNACGYKLESKICQKTILHFSVISQCVCSFHLKLNCIKHFNSLGITHKGRAWYLRTLEPTFPPSLELTSAGNEQDCLSQWGLCDREPVQYWEGNPTHAPLLHPPWTGWSLLPASPQALSGRILGLLFLFVAKEDFGHQKLHTTSWGGRRERFQFCAAPVLCWGQSLYLHFSGSHFSRRGP